MLKKKRKEEERHIFFSIFGMLCVFLWPFISSGPSLHLLDFPLSSFLPIQICRCDVNITLVDSNDILIIGTCTSHKDPSVPSARLSRSLTKATTWIDSENLMLHKACVYLLDEPIV